MSGEERLWRVVTIVVAVITALVPVYAMYNVYNRGPSPEKQLELTRIGLFGTLLVASAPIGPRAAEPALVLLDAELDRPSRALIIRGEHLGSSSPLVIVDGVPLVLTSWSTVDIHAQLPPAYDRADSVQLEVYRGPLMDDHAALRIEMHSLAERLQGQTDPPEH